MGFPQFHGESTPVGRDQWRGFREFFAKKMTESPKSKNLPNKFALLHASARFSGFLIKSGSKIIYSVRPF
jgi:hypothetical protein